MILKNINKKYGNKVVFKDFNFECENDDFVVVLGKSGVGKTTLLNIIANLTDYEGQIIGINSVSYMFQDDILLESLTVLENLALTLKVKRKEIEKLAEEYNISDSLNLKPSELSGGIARRVSLIRALHYKADVLLLDEPTKSLDSENKNICLENIKARLKKEPRLTLCVTHDFNDFEDFATKILRI